MKVAITLLPLLALGVVIWPKTEGSSATEIAATTPGDPDLFIHPARAYSIACPKGSSIQSFVDPLGIPFHVLTEEPAEREAAIASGVWLHSYPITTGDGLTLPSILPMATSILRAKDPELRLKGEPEPDDSLCLPALRFQVAGTRNSGQAWQGECFLLLAPDQFLLAHCGSAPQDFDAKRALFLGHLATLRAPLPSIPRSTTPRPSGSFSEAEAKELLRRCTPRIQVLARTDLKDEETNVFDFASGTGFLIDPRGYVITNRHVVESYFHQSANRLCYDEVLIEFDHSLKIAPQRAHVIAVSKRFDLALLKIKGQEVWPSIPLAEVDTVKPGHRLLVAGWPEPKKYGQKTLTIADGKALGIRRDASGRAIELEHDAFTRPGSSGGPIFDLDLGAIVGAHYVAYTFSALVDGVHQEIAGGYKGGVPVERLLTEFPQIAQDWTDLVATPEDRRALVAYYFLQERFGAAFIETQRLLEEEPEDGLTHAYAYRMYALQRDSERAHESLLQARRKKESEFLAVLFASQSALEVEDPIESSRWNGEALRMAPGHPAALLSLLRTQVMTGGSAPQFLAMTQTAFGEEPHPEIEFLKGYALLTSTIRDLAIVTLPPKRAISEQVIIDAKIAIQRSIDLWPARQGLSYASLALIHALDGRKKPAREMRARALAAAEEDPKALLGVAWFDLTHGDFASARAQIAAANRLRGSSFGLFLTGWANLLEASQLSKGNPKRAQQLAAEGRREIMTSTEGPTRKLWWRNLASHVLSEFRRI